VTTKLISAADQQTVSGHPPQRRSPVVITTVIAGVLTVLFAALMPLAPVTVNDPGAQWPLDPSAPRSTRLSLVNYEPLGLDARFSCATAAAAAASGGVVLSTIDPDTPAARERGLLVRSAGGRLSVDGPDLAAPADVSAPPPVATPRELAERRIVDEPLPAGACAYRVTADPAAGIVVTRDGVEVGRGPAGVLPDVHALVTTVTSLPGATAGDLAVTVRIDDGFNSAPAPAKLVLMALLALAAAVTVTGLVLLERRAERPAFALPRPRPRLIDLAVPAVMVLWVFLAPMSDDDGYYSAMARNVEFEGYVGNYYQILNQGFTPFSWFYLFLAKWQTLGLAPVVLRIPALVFGLVTWAALRCFVSRAGVLPAGWRERSRWVDRGARLVVGTVFLVWWLPLDMGVRPEGVVTMCGVLVLLFTALAVERRNLLHLAAAVGIGGVGFFAHPTGFTVAAPLVAGLPAIAALVRRDAPGPLVVTARVLGLVATGAVAVFLAFADGSLRDFLHGQELFLRIQSQESWYTEFARYAFLLNPGDPMANYAKRAPVLLCVVALVWFVVLITAARARRVAVPPRFALAGFATLAAFFLLWFTPSKWSHHFGSVTGIGTAFLALMALGSIPLLREVTRGRAVRVPVVLAVVASVTAMTALAGHGANTWPYSWLQGMPHPDVPPGISVLRADSPLLWLAAIVVAALGVHRLAGRRAPGARPFAALIGTVLVVLLFFTATTAHLVGGFAVAAVRTADTWSPWAASLRDPLARDCVAADAIDVLDPASARALAPLPGGEPALLDGFAENSGWYRPGPPPSGVGDTAWGSLVPSPGAVTPEETTGRLRTPWYDLGAPLTGGEALTTFVAGRLGPVDGANTLVAEFGDASGAVLREQPLAGDADSTVWRGTVLAEAGGVPAGATAVRLVARDRTVDSGGWLAVTSPSVLRPVPLREALPRDAAVAVAWQFAFLFPCQRQPRVRDGIVEPISYAVQWGTSTTGALGDATWQAQRGGLFGDVLVSQSVTALPTGFPDFPAERRVHVFATEPNFPDQQYTPTRASRTLFGWEAMS
jgi:hypothetical protein